MMLLSAASAAVAAMCHAPGADYVTEAACELICIILGLSEDDGTSTQAVTRNQVCH
jgi:hypothetical protein